MLFLGTTYTAGGSVGWDAMVGGSASYLGSAEYKPPLLSWSLEYYYYRYLGAPVTTYCGYYYWTSFGTNYGGAYYELETVNNLSYGYDLWSFTAVDTYTDITVDTTDPKTAFDPFMTVMDSTTCILGRADDAFACTYPPIDYSCPSIHLPTTKGTSYTILVEPIGSHWDIVGDYKLSLDTIADPSLTLVADDVPTADTQYLTVEGWVHIP